MSLTGDGQANRASGGMNELIFLLIELHHDEEYVLKRKLTIDRCYSKRDDADLGAYLLSVGNKN